MVLISDFVFQFIHLNTGVKNGAQWGKEEHAGRVEWVETSVAGDLWQKNSG